MIQLGTSHHRRLAVHVEGRVQGVGFRPFVYRLAKECGLAGWIRNSPNGADIEVEGDPAHLRRFLQLFRERCPPIARLDHFSYLDIPPLAMLGFAIRESEQEGERSVIIPPDIATCDDCLREILDPKNRRYRYPFTSCAHCGPRYTILRDLPYDRLNTTMAGFALCADCRREYEDPADRRYHAQPIACPVCGPQLALWDGEGHTLAITDAALTRAARALRAGRIVALKGLGGFQLLVDATQAAAVRKLRRRKNRPDKPLATMMRDVKEVKKFCRVDDAGARLLRSPEAPIVLMSKGAPTTGVRRIAPEVAPFQKTLGVMLPYTPLHHLLLMEVGRPVVATSGNLSEEPICIDEREALDRLGDIADFFLVHDRPIQRPVDDSVARIYRGEAYPIRQARGCTPAVVPIGGNGDGILALGGHLKNTAAIGIRNKIIVGPHHGDLDSPDTREILEKTVAWFRKMYRRPPRELVCDEHPDYGSTLVARRLRNWFDVPLRQVQHHLAHVAACMAEQGLSGSVLGISWDGTGFGEDGTIWGGEFLQTDLLTTRRVAHFRPFPLPGGEAAIREPQRAASGLLYAHLGERLFAEAEWLRLASLEGREGKVVASMLRKRINCPQTTSVGRLFDAVAALLEIGAPTTYEGQAAMRMEYEIGEAPPAEPAWRFRLRREGTDDPLVIDWTPVIERLLREKAAGSPRAHLARAFHDALAAAAAQVAMRVGEKRVVLTGGCFQNMYLLERTVRLLENRGFQPFWHRIVPPNDGGLALGQIALAVARAGKERESCALPSQAES